MAGSNAEAEYATRFNCPRCQKRLKSNKPLRVGVAELTCPTCGARFLAGATHVQADPVASAKATASLNYDTPRSPGITPTSPSYPPQAPGLPEVAGYTILGEIGRGGMGVVYKARHVKLKRIVALKMIMVDPAPSPEYLTQFEIEAEAVARIHHPNIVQIYEVGDPGGRPYLALEFVNGGNLRKCLDGRPQPARASAQLIEMLARAVHAAHRRGIIHRDLKPANVLLEPSTVEADWDGASEEHIEAGQLYGVPKIADFGLAKRLDEDDAPARYDEVLGTPYFMAPEQALGRNDEVGPATDIYSLGAILYEMLTGRPPFKAATIEATLKQTVMDPPVPPRSVRKNLPRDLEAICLRCLEKEPSKRYRSGMALADDLARFLRGEPIRARRLTPPKRLWNWSLRYPAPASILIAVTVLLLLGQRWVPKLSDDIVLRTARANADQQAEIVMQNHRLYSDVIAGGKRAFPDLKPTHKWSPGSDGEPIPARYTISLTEILSARADERKTNAKPGVGTMSSRLRIYSNYPFTRRHANPPSKDSFAGRALAFYEGKTYQESDESEPYVDDKFDPDDSSDRAFRYAKPFIMAEACIQCHNEQRLYDEDYKQNASRKQWKVGEVRGVLAIEIPLNSEYNRIDKSVHSTYMNLILISAGTLAAVWLVLAGGKRLG
jgi:serine/threonine protein kinase